MAIAFFPQRRKLHQRVDAAVPADAQNAPTGTWKTAQTAVSHSAHTHRHLTSSTHKIPDTPDREDTSRTVAPPSHGDRFQDGLLPKATVALAMQRRQEMVDHKISHISTQLFTADFVETKML